MKVVLLNLIGIDRTKLVKRLPINLIYLATSILDKVDSVKVENISRFNLPRLKKIIRKEDPDIIGIGCYGEDRIGAFKAVKLIKNINPNIKIIMGGMLGSSLYELVLNNFPVDIIVIGEGERTLPEIIETFKKNKQLKNIKGITYKHNNKIIKTKPRPIIKNLDEIPIPHYKLFYKYKGSNKDNWLPLISSRGCFYKCNYCWISYFWGNTFRTFSIPRIVNEMRELIQMTKCNNLVFYNLIFKNYKKELIKFCREIKKEKLDIQFILQSRADNINKECLYWLQKIGCKTIAIGVESGSQMILNKVGKQLKTEQYIKAFKMIKNFNIGSSCSLVVGLPGETKKTIMKTADLIKKIKPDELRVNFATLYPSTPLYDTAKRQNLISDDYWLSNKYPKIYTGVMSLKELLFYRYYLEIKHAHMKSELDKYFISKSKKIFALDEVQSIHQ